MNKTLAIKIAIFLLVTTIGYSGFWFFKTGQIERKVNSFITENSLNIASSSVMVSGFPFSQKITINDLKLTIPHSLFNKYQIIIKKIEISSGIFSDNFELSSLENVSVLDSEVNIARNVEFNSQPKIRISFNDTGINEFSYNDSGYKITDLQKNIFYSSKSNNLNLASGNKDGRLSYKINGEIKEIEGMDLASLYQNSAEKKITNALKTGEISLNPNHSNQTIADIINKNNPQNTANVINNDSLNIPNPQSSTTTASTIASSSQVAGNIPQDQNSANNASQVNNQIVANTNSTNLDSNIAVANNSAGTDGSSNNSATATNVNTANTTNTASNIPANGDVKNPPLSEQGKEKNSTEQLAAISSEAIKNNLIIDIEYYPNSQPLDVANDNNTPSITPVVANPTNPADSNNPLNTTNTGNPENKNNDPINNLKSGSSIVKINNIEFSNSQYKINISGQIENFGDDSLPSGSISIKLENFTNFKSYVTKSLSKMIEEKFINVNKSTTSPYATDANSNNENIAKTDTTSTNSNIKNDNVVAASSDTQKDAGTPTNTNPTNITDSNNLAQNQINNSNNNANPSDQQVKISNIANSQPLSSYEIFLYRLIANFPNISDEISQKNPLSKDNIVVFDIKREKNIEFFVNDVALREIIGKI